MMAHWLWYQTRAPAHPAAERAQGGIVRDRVAAVEDLLEWLIEQVQGAAATSTMENDGPFALAAGVLGRQLE